MLKKVAFVLDTGSSYNLLNSPDVYVLPINIHINDNNNKELNFFENNINRNEIYNHINNNHMIKTSQPIIGDAIQLFEKLIKQYDLVIVIPFSRHLSNTYSSIKSVANQIDKNKIIVLDANPMSITGNWCVNEIKEYINNSKNININKIEQIAKKYTKKQCGMLILNDLKQLIAGGRLKGIKAILVKILKLKLCIKYNGDLEFVAKEMSMENAINKSIEIIDKKIKFTKLGIKRVAIFPELNNEEDNKKYCEYLKQKLNVLNVEYALLPTSVIVHTGPNTFSFIIESN